MDRQDFMSFFRDTEKINTLSTDDRIEVFSSILSGGSDITPELLQKLLRDYGVDGVVVYDKKQLFDRFPILSTESVTTTITQAEKELPQQLVTGDSYTYKESNKLDKGIWYTYREGSCDWLMNYQGGGCVCYGFNTSESWRNDYMMELRLNWKRATHEEIRTALIKEARKRGYTENNFKTLIEDTSGFDADFDFTYLGDTLFCKPEGRGGAVVYQNGVWADLITVDTENGEVSYDTDTQKNTKLTKGKWYKNLTHEGSYFLFKEVGDYYHEGCGVNYEGIWYDNGKWGIDNSYREATQQKVEEILIKEARSRGYKGGQVIKSFVYGESCLSDEGEGFKFDIHENRLWYNRNILFQDGEWAEVIND